jgi:hypothetical protein
MIDQGLSMSWPSTTTRLQHHRQFQGEIKKLQVRFRFYELGLELYNYYAVNCNDDTVEFKMQKFELLTLLEEINSYKL